ncbi:Vegetative incompatibility protein HET-E-1-like protein 15 [Colletotrichum sojae]|uniref:Mitochondrial division protein 1 n=1 Tax=Colletotrichum sojae TaxID=2175907 RepID=A0A8H6MNY0_9PEZI|nr:Vegetative incompatibility protein HET-E-1-like protein 15 [Colletotrichum sojae]
MRYFRTPIEIDPAQVYLSALVFSPTGSIIRGLFRAEEPKWPVKPVADQDWSPCLQTLEGHEDYVNSVDISPDRATLASASDDGTVKLWDTATGHCLRTLPLQGRGKSVAFSTDGTMLASASDSVIKLWSMVTGHCLRTLPTRGNCISVAFSSDGTTLASGSNRSVFQLWDTKSGQCLHTLRGHRGTVYSVVFSGDSSLLASGSSDKTVRLWQTSTGICLRTIDRDSEVSSIALSHDGTRLASVSSSGVEVCNLKTNDCIQPLKDGIHTDFGPVAFSPSGTQIAFDLDRIGLHLWDITTNQSKGVLTGHHGIVTSVVFSGGGSLLASASRDAASIKLWNLTVDDPHSPCQVPETQSNASSDPGLYGRELKRSTHQIIRFVRNACKFARSRKQNQKGEAGCIQFPQSSHAQIS